MRIGRRSSTSRGPSSRGGPRGWSRHGARSGRRGPRRRPRPISRWRVPGAAAGRAQPIGDDPAGARDRPARPLDRPRLPRSGARSRAASGGSSPIGCRSGSRPESGPPVAGQPLEPGLQLAGGLRRGRAGGDGDPDPGDRRARVRPAARARRAASPICSGRQHGWPRCSTLTATPTGSASSARDADEQHGRGTLGARSRRRDARGASRSSAASRSRIPMSNCGAAVARALGLDPPSSRTSRHADLSASRPTRGNMNDGAVAGDVGLLARADHGAAFARDAGRSVRAGHFVGHVRGLGPLPALRSAISRTAPAGDHAHALAARRRTTRRRTCAIVGCSAGCAGVAGPHPRGRPERRAARRRAPGARRTRSCSRSSAAMRCRSDTGSAAARAGLREVSRDVPRQPGSSRPRPRRRASSRSLDAPALPGPPQRRAVRPADAAGSARRSSSTRRSRRRDAVSAASRHGAELPRAGSRDRRERTAEFPGADRNTILFALLGTRPGWPTRTPAFASRQRRASSPGRARSSRSSSIRARRHGVATAQPVLEQPVVDGLRRRRSTRRRLSANSSRRPPGTRSPALGHAGTSRRLRPIVLRRARAPPAVRPPVGGARPARSRGPRHLLAPARRLDHLAAPTRRLDALRAAAPDRRPPRRLRLGRRPAPKPRSTPVADAAAGEPARCSTTATNAGFVHAPSLSHAATAAVLRSGHLSHARAGASPTAVRRSTSPPTGCASRRWLLDGVRQGQPLGALLGYRFERGLHDRSRPGLELDRFIRRFRAARAARRRAGASTSPRRWARSRRSPRTTSSTA